MHATSPVATAARSGRRVLRAAGATDVGRQRQANEDRFHVDTARGVFIVVDGVGGHAAGGQAADSALAALCGRLNRETGSVPDRVREAITIANNEVHRLASTRPDWRGMACVLTVAVVDGGHAVVGHVGDSRLYRLRAGEIEKVTPDHSPVGEREDANELSELEAMHHPRRNEVYRDVGSEPHALEDQDFVFLTTIDLPSDAALLLCSDGLTDLVPSDTIREIAAAYAGAPPEVVRHLIDAANAAGGKDNVTAVYVEGERVAAARLGPRAEPAQPEGRPRPGWLVSVLGPLALVAAFVGGAVWQSAGTPGAPGGPLASPAASAIVVRAEESIAAAIAAAAPGTTVVVEPGVYRERLTLRDNVRVISRVSRGATLRPPTPSSGSDAMVVAAGVTNAELSGFRIVGDADAPLAAGVMTRNAAVRLVDLEVTGATIAAIDLGVGEGVLLTGSDLRDNPGAALVVRAGATPRVAHNLLAGSTSPVAPPTLTLEPGASPDWIGNVIRGGSAEVIGRALGAGGAATAAHTTDRSFDQNNWFPDTPARAGARTPARGARTR
jgi:serine/threonine protein phosphatase PrpC